MEYEQFKKELVELVTERLEQENLEIKVIPVVKNNHVEKEGLVCHEKNSNTSPIIYLDEVYHWYQEMSDMDEVADRVMKLIDERVELDGYALIGAWDKVKSQVGIKLVNYEWNKEKLSDVPHKRVLDLAVVPFLNVELEQLGGKGTVAIHNKFLEIWGIEEEELWEAAEEWLEKEEFECKNIFQLLLDVADELPDMPQGDSLLYVLGNRSRINGAVAMLRKDLLREFAELTGGSFYILPSSLHECLLLPETTMSDCEHIKEMIAAVNDSEVKAEERLSYSLYYYDYQTGELEIK